MHRPAAGPTDFRRGCVIDGIAMVVKCVASPQVALTKAEQSTPMTSRRGALRVQTLPAITPRAIFARICPSAPWHPQQYGMPRTS